MRFNINDRGAPSVTSLPCNNNNNNNNDFFCANILENQVQWRDKIKGLSKLVIENNA